MKKITALALSISTFLLSLVHSAEPTAEQIMTAVRQTAVLQNEQNLTGVIRKGSKKVPLNLFLMGKDIQFKIDGGKEGFHLRLKEDDQELWEIVNGKPQRFQDKKIGAPIAKTDLSYEDLALKFLYWKNPRLMGTQKVNGINCYYVHLVNPDKAGRYREISVWVAVNQMALVRIVGYGPRPEAVPLKQFEITDVMKVNGVFTVETMKVTQFDKDRRVSGVTYLEFESPK